MQKLLLSLFSLESLFISVSGFFKEVPVEGEWQFRTERLPDGTIYYRPVKDLFADPPADHSHDCAGFSYNDSLPSGPQHWGTICLQWAACTGTGGRQSPIDIVTSNTVRQPTGTLKENYQPQWNTTIINEPEHLNFFGVLLDKSNYISGGPLDDDYQLLSFHYHTPSEHTVDGVRYPLELHLVHSTINKQPTALAVVGIFFEASDEFSSLALDQFIAAMNNLEDKVTPHLSTQVILTLHQEIFPTDKEKTFFSYPGSLTTPPCAEIVRWLVMETPLIAGRRQIDFLKSYIGDPVGNNSRPVQTLGPRTISHFTVTTSHGPGSLPPGGVAAIVLLLIFVFLGAFLYCSITFTKEKRVIFCGRVTDWEYVGYTSCPPFRPASGSLNAGPASDEQEDDDEEEEGIKEAPKSKGKSQPKEQRDEDEEDEDEHVTKGGPERGGKKKPVEEDDDDEERQKDKRPASKKHAGGSAYGTTADDEDFDAPSSKKPAGRGH